MINPNKLTATFSGTTTDDIQLDELDEDQILETNIDPIHIGVIAYRLHLQPDVVNDPLATIKHQQIAYGIGNQAACDVSQRIRMCFDDAKNNSRENRENLCSTASNINWNALATTETTKMADALINHYRGRFTMSKLQNHAFSPYERLIYNYIFREQRGDIMHNEIGMLSTLPAAYQNEMETARCIELCNTDLNYGSAVSAVADSNPATLIGGYTTLGRSAQFNLIFRETEGDNRMVDVGLTKSAATQFILSHLNNDPDVTLSFQPIPLRRRGDATIVRVVKCEILPANMKRFNM